MAFPGEGYTRSHGRTLALAGVMLVLFAIDIVLPPEFVVLPFLAFPIVLGAAIAGPGEVIALGALGAGMSVAAGIQDGTWGQANGWLWLEALIVVTAAAAVVSYARRAAIERAETASGRLRESERHFKAIAENSGDVVPETDDTDTVTWVSPSIHDILGWHAEDVLGIHISDMTHPDDDIRPSGLVPMGSGRQVRVLTARGDWHIMQATTRTRANGDGKDTRTTIGLRDVDELVQARVEAETSNERLRGTLDSMLDPHVTLKAVRDETGRTIDFSYEDANHAALAYNRTTREHLVGQRLLDILPHEGPKGIVEQYAHVLETGEPLALDSQEYIGGKVGLTRYLDVRAVRTDGDTLSFSWRDVTDRYMDDVRIQASEEKYRLLAENSSDMILLVEGEYITWASPSVTTMLGGAPEDWIGRSMEDFVAAEHLEMVRDMGKLIPELGSATLRHKAVNAAGTTNWVEVRAKPYVNGKGEEQGSILSMRIVDEQVEAERELERLARYDTLTGLMNRSEALSRLGEFKEGQRRRGTGVAVLFCDVDNFKQVNDTFGHKAGDTVLSTIAERVLRCIRKDDHAARIGGDEILVLLEGVDDIETAVKVAENIRKAVSGEIPVDRGTVNATLSIGVTMARPDEEIDQLVERADTAMYEAKRGGRNRVIAID